MTKRMIYFVVALVVLLPIASMAILRMLATKPGNLGIKDGQLAACPSSPNCVSTQSKDKQHFSDPITYSGSPKDAMQDIKTALGALPRVRVVTETDTYLHAEATSFLFRFVDDVEFFLDEKNGLIHFRSASRTGYSDLGLNRSRMERFRVAFQRLGN